MTDTATKQAANQVLITLLPALRLSFVLVCLLSRLALPAPRAPMFPGLCRRRSALASFFALANILPVARAIADYPSQSFFFEWKVNELTFPAIPFPVPVTGIYLPRLSAHVGTDLVQRNATSSISHGLGVQQRGKHASL
jgi:hypothetical protein